jgi:methylglutaconyl-CoA hydratase
MPNLQPKKGLRVEPFGLSGVSSDAENAPLLRITLARPEKRNAFNEDLIAHISEAFMAAAQQPGLRAVVLAADGPAFCAGADLDWMRRSADFSYEDNVRDAQALAAMLQAIRDCPVPVIARIQGDAFGGGVGLMAACDIAFALDSARFCLSEVKLGLVPAVISPYVLSKIGLSAAQRYFLSAELFSAQEAYRLGLLHELSENEEALDARLAQFLKILLANGPEAMRASKRLVRQLDDIPWSRITDLTTALIAERRASPEGREGIRAFLERRPPAWQGAATL